MTNRTPGAAKDTADFARRKGDGNRRALRASVTKGEPAGPLAYERAESVGWCPGAGVLDGFPPEPRHGELPAAFAWTGTVSAWREAGFVEAACRSATWPILRLTVSEGTTAGAAVAVGRRVQGRS